MNLGLGSIPGSMCPQILAIAGRYCRLSGFFEDMALDGMPSKTAELSAISEGFVSSNR